MTKQTFLKNRADYLSTNNAKSVSDLYRQFKTLSMQILYSYDIAQEDKEDIASLAVNSAILGLGSYNDEYSFKTWFGTILKNKLKDFYRKQKVLRVQQTKSIDSFFSSEESEAEPLTIADAFDCPVNRLTNEYLLTRLKAKIGELNNEQKRKILTFYFVEGLTCKEIIESTKCDKVFVNVTIHRFKKNFNH